MTAKEPKQSGQTIERPCRVNADVAEQQKAETVQSGFLMRANKKHIDKEKAKVKSF